MVASRRRLFSIGKQHGDSSEKLKIELPYDPAVPLLGIYPKELKTLILKDTCIPMFIAALLITAKTWKQHKCPLTDEWIKKMCHMCVCVCTCTHTHTYVHTMEYYSAIKKNGASLVAQWLRICLLMQGTRVRALVWEDPTCHGAAGPVSHSY